MKTITELSLKPTMPTKNPRHRHRARPSRKCSLSDGSRLRTPMALSSRGGVYTAIVFATKRVGRVIEGPGSDFMDVKYQKWVQTRERKMMLMR